MKLMSSDMASMQSFDLERNQLRLLAWKGFHPQSAIFWERVHLDSACSCGLALSAGCRVVVPDTMTIDDVEHYTAEEKQRIIASYPKHELEARTKGIPVLGSGRIFP